MSVPVLGAALAFVVFAAAGQPVAAGKLIPAIVAAWIATAVGAWVKLRFDASARCGSR